MMGERMFDVVGVGEGQTRVARLENARIGGLALE